MKEKISISLDKDVFDEVQKRSSNISAYINKTLKEKFARQPSVQELLSENNAHQGALIYAMRDALNSIESVLDKITLENREFTDQDIEAIRNLFRDFQTSLDALEKSRIVARRALELLGEIQPKSTESLSLSLDDVSLGDILGYEKRKLGSE